MSLNQLPRMDAAHIDESGDIQFFTADGREGVITELGSTLIRSTRLGGVNVDALTTEFELPEEAFVEPAERPMPMTKAEEFGLWNGGMKYSKWTRGEGHISKIRK